MQKLVKEGPLLSASGDLLEAGYAFSLVKEYNRNLIKVNKLRIKEWDYYYIGNNSKGVAFTIDDNGYMGLGSVSILDFEKKTYITKSNINWFPKGKTDLPPSSKEGLTFYDKNGWKLAFDARDGIRRIDVKVDKYDGFPFEAHFELKETTKDSMVIVTPFLKKKHFYYNQKINCLKANGYYLYKGEKVEFNEVDSRAVLDWGRGVWTYKNTWYWSSLNTIENGKEVGFNLGYGFGDTSAASENVIFYDGHAIKEEDVTFNIPKDKKGNYLYLEPWTVKSTNGDIDLTFTPVLDRKDCTNALLIKSFQHQVFGYFDGTLKVEGKEIKINHKISFAERVTNYW